MTRTEAILMVNSTRQNIINQRSAIKGAVQSVTAAVTGMASNIAAVEAMQAEYPEYVDQKELEEWKATHKAAVAALVANVKAIEDLLT